MIKDTRGFTAVELLVAITVTGVIVSLGFKGYRFFQQNFLRWQQRVVLEENSRRIMKAITLELQNLRRIVKAERHSLSFINEKRKRVIYSFEAWAVYKNGRTLLPAEIQAERLEFEYYPAEVEHRYFDFLGDPERVSKIRIHLVLQSRQSDVFDYIGGGSSGMELISVVHLRSRRDF